MSKAKFAFVSTNSVCQGEQVLIDLAEYIFFGDLKYYLLITSFKWSNSAKSDAIFMCYHRYIV